MLVQIVLSHRNGHSTEDCCCDLLVVVHPDGRCQTRSCREGRAARQGEGTGKIS